MITLKIKMPTKQHDIQIEDNASVTELRKIVAQTVSKEPGQLVLIFGGKILKDEDTLATHSIQNGHSVHLVIKNQRQVNLFNRKLYRTCKSGIEARS